MTIDEIKNTCDECYAMRQPHICICDNCGKKTMVSVVEGISAVSRCTNCGWGCVSAGGYPPSCHEDDRLYALIVHKPEDKKKMVKLADLLSVRVLDLIKEFKDDIIERRYHVLECLTRYEQLKELDIKCEIDQAIVRNFKRIMGCEYVGRLDIKTGAIILPNHSNHEQ
jgi:hypothetical protein